MSQSFTMSQQRKELNSLCSLQMSLKIDSHDFNQQRGRFRLIFNCRSSEALEEMGWVNVESVLLDIKNNLDNVS